VPRCSRLSLLYPYGAITPERAPAPKIRTSATSAATPIRWRRKRRSACPHGPMRRDSTCSATIRTEEESKAGQPLVQARSIAPGAEHVEALRLGIEARLDAADDLVSDENGEDVVTELA